MNIFCIVIILGFLAELEAKPFINPFNVAIKTEFGEEGNKLTFVYPKNAFKVDLKLKREKLNGHEFNIGQFFGHVARQLGRNLSSFNPFALSSGFTTKTTTTTESSFDFGPDDNVSIPIISGSTEATSDGDVSANGHNADETESVNESTPSFTYLPPQTTPNYYVPPSSVYLPPSIKRQ